MPRRANPRSDRFYAVIARKPWRCSACNRPQPDDSQKYVDNRRGYGLCFECSRTEKPNPAAGDSAPDGDTP